jgi:hypothetical protein
LISPLLRACDHFDNPLLCDMNVLRLTGPMISISSFIMSTARPDIFLKNWFCWRFAGSLECLCDGLLVDALDDFANRRVIESGDVFEDEHQFPDGIGNLGLLVSIILQHRTAALAIETIEQSATAR